MPLTKSNYCPSKVALDFIWMSVEIENAVRKTQWDERKIKRYYDTAEKEG